MTILAIKLLIDSIMIMLLGATIFYCIIVNKRIRVLQDSREEFSQLITKFDETTRKAQESIEDLQKMSQRVTESLNERLDKANFLADDLAFMIEKGNKTADKVFNTLSKEEKQAAPVVPPRREASFERARQPQSQPQPQEPRSASAAAKEALMRATGRSNPMPEDISPAGSRRPAATTGMRASARPRSRAEQDLQKALRPGGDE